MASGRTDRRPRSRCAPSQRPILANPERPDGTRAQIASVAADSGARGAVFVVRVRARVVPSNRRPLSRRRLRSDRRRRSRPPSASWVCESLSLSLSSCVLWGGTGSDGARPPRAFVRPSVRPSVCFHSLTHSLSRLSLLRLRVQRNLMGLRDTRDGGRAARVLCSARRDRTAGEASRGVTGQQTQAGEPAVITTLTVADGR